MILDSQLTFSDAQAVTSAAASTNAIDVSEARNLGEGRPLFVVTVIDTTMNDGGTNAGLDVYMYGDSTSTFTPDGKNLLFTIPAKAAAGTGPYVGVIPPSFASGVGAGNYQFLELHYDPVTADLTAGAFSSYLVLDIAGFVAYKRGYTIS